MTLPMARDMGRYGIRFVTLAPGPMKTPMGAKIPQKVVEAL
jgi:NAD(P)-dependent dehydrogenase (short-subunit alcohol dehydrogenase family)